MQKTVTALLLLAASLVHAQKTVIYRVEYTNGTCSGTDLAPLTLTFPSSLDTAMDVMERAVREGGERYNFRATFSDANGDIGYVVDHLNGVDNMAPCYWAFYIRSGSNLFMPSLSVSDYVPGDSLEVIMRYEALIAAPTITTRYILDYPDPFCFDGNAPTPVTVVTRSGNSALDVMEEAVAQGGREYNFSVNYAEVMDSFGYVIHQLNGVATNGSCSWVVTVTSPGGMESILTVPVSEYTLPGTGYTLTLRFVEPEIPSVTTHGSATKTVVNIALLFISCTVLGLFV